MVNHVEFKYVKPVKPSSITLFEQIHNFPFPTEFVDFFLKYNGAKPYYDEFESLKDDRIIQRCIKTFLSFNEHDKENIWTYSFNHMSENDFAVPFAIDNFGNLICFNADYKVELFNHETGKYEPVADSFDEFVKSLKSLG